MMEGVNLVFDAVSVAIAIGLIEGVRWLKSRVIGGR